jgi:hypothetical protein
LDLGECGLSVFEAEAREPPQRGALESLRFGLADGDADRERIAEVDARQLGGGVADQDEVACLEGPSEAGVCRSLACAGCRRTISASDGRLSSSGRACALAMAPGA